MIKEIAIDGLHIHDIASFYEEINRVFMSDEDWKIGNSLDAFNDLLYGGFGAMKDCEKVRFVWKNVERMQEALGYKATKAYYEDKLQQGALFNKEYFREKLIALENGTGETYFEMLKSIVAAHKNIDLVLV
ncbi:MULTISPECIES: barstar family protein [Olivibacter]|uniref:Barstar family protein n=2 Tax=Sphingobacteriaceae TaxID=84566 RepID=A0ABW6B2J1_9SPHI|nr:barstar family protein [Olivibacter sp. UJ_SKK_5.1]MDX3916562.1 barstar family protein [Pseudosphingobacterium sp.]